MRGPGMFKTILTAIAEFITLVLMFGVFYVLLWMAPGIDAAIIEWKAGG
jgi:hypothetical protein